MTVVTTLLCNTYMYLVELTSNAIFEIQGKDFFLNISIFKLLICTKCHTPTKLLGPFNNQIWNSNYWLMKHSIINRNLYSIVGKKQTSVLHIE